MTHYQHSFTVAACPAAVYAALSTLDGLRAWWSLDCEGDTGVGGTIGFRFGACAKDMLVERLVPGVEVRWRCVGAHIVAPAVTRPDEWVGTELVFRLSATEQGATLLAFEHIGLAPTLQCYEVCNKGWQYFLSSLQQYLETGEGTPYCPPHSTPARVIHGSATA